MAAFEDSSFPTMLMDSAVKDRSCPHAIHTTGQVDRRRIDCHFIVDVSVIPSISFRYFRLIFTLMIFVRYQIEQRIAWRSSSMSLGRRLIRAWSPGSCEADELYEIKSNASDVSGP